MAKVKLGPSTMAYPLPAFLVGSNVEGKANFMTVAWGGIAADSPPMLSVAIKPFRYTMKGINENRVFSVNIPSEGQVYETDLCGIVSGSKYDKAAICGFDVFYGKLCQAPMIEQCPVNFECKLEHTLNLGSHLLIVGSIKETFASESCIRNGKLDVNKIRPLIYSSGVNREYIGFGEAIAPAFKAGRNLKRNSCD